MRIFPGLDFRLGSWFGEDESPVLEFRRQRIQVDQVRLIWMSRGQPLGQATNEEAVGTVVFGFEAVRHWIFTRVFQEITGNDH